MASASLRELLASEGFEHRKFLTSRRKKVKFRDKVAAGGDDESAALLLPKTYICLDHKGLEFSTHEKGASSRRAGDSDTSGRSIARYIPAGSYNNDNNNNNNEPPSAAIDDVAVRAVISILSGYIGRYSREENFRQAMRDKCFSCFTRKKTKTNSEDEDSDDGIFTNLELGIGSIDKLVECPRPAGTKQQQRLQSLQNSIRLLSSVASLNSRRSINGVTCGTPNSSLSACAQLYLSIVYKLDKNDRVSATHLLQVFCDSPFLARTHLLPELWEHFFLPHLLHLKIWYRKQLQFLSESDYGDKERRLKALTLSKTYNDRMDKGTVHFALYYKQWLKVGAQAPAAPSVPLPSRPSYGHSRRRSSDSFTTNSSVNKSLYRTVFGPNFVRRSIDLDDRTEASTNTWGFHEEVENADIDDYDFKKHDSFETRTGAHSRQLSQSNGIPNADTHKSEYFWFLRCRGEPKGCIVDSSQLEGNSLNKKAVTPHPLPSSDLSRATSTICSSDSISGCEMAIRVIAKAWIDSHGDPSIEASLSHTRVIEGILEVLVASSDDEILELAVSILAELVTRKEMNGRILLNSDPQLDTFMKLLRSSRLFLKASALLYLVKPKAKQMVSMEWVPLVLRVLEFGDQLQTLLTVRCNPQVAAYYFLDQLLTGFDEDKNLENARQVVSLGGLSLLARRIERGDISEKSKAASIIYCCVQADGSCRHYLANNLKKDSIIELLVFRKQIDQSGHAFALLTELLYLHRTSQRTKLLNGLISGLGSLNAMHVLLIYLQRAPQEERPVIAAILLQLDLLGDPLNSSAYREESVETIVAALDCQMCNEKVQEQSAKALSVLGGRFTYMGEPEAEKWLLKEAGFDESSVDSFHGKDFIVDRFLHLNKEDEETENWQRKTAMILLTCGNKRFLAALSDSLANGIPCLARASLVTISWVSSYLHAVGDENLQSMACSILVHKLIEFLNYHKALEERVLASFSLLNLTKSADCVSKGIPLSKEQTGCLRNLSQVTWTATELISIITSGSNSRH